MPTTAVRGIIRTAADGVKAGTVPKRWQHGARAGAAPSLDERKALEKLRAFSLGRLATFR
jgi:hypothetical protein